MHINAKRMPSPTYHGPLLYAGVLKPLTTAPDQRNSPEDGDSPPSRLRAQGSQYVLAGMST